QRAPSRVRARHRRGPGEDIPDEDAGGREDRGDEPARAHPDPIRGGRAAEARDEGRPGLDPRDLQPGGVMNEPGLAPFSAEGIRLVPALSGDAVRVSMSGIVDMRDPGELLNPFWIALDA